MKSLIPNNLIKKNKKKTNQQKKYNNNYLKHNKTNLYLTSHYKNENDKKIINIKNNNFNTNTKDLFCNKIISKNNIICNNNYCINKKNTSKVIKVKKIIEKKNDIIKENFIKKLKFLQLWWKTIYLIIKIQKIIRGFLFREKLISYLDKSEKIYDFILKLFKCIKKIFCKQAFYIFVKKSNKKKFIKIKRSKKNFMSRENSRIKLRNNLEKSNSMRKKLRNNSINKFNNEKASSIKYKKNIIKSLDKNKNRNFFDNLDNKKNYFKEFYNTTHKTILNRTTIVKSQNNLITIINNTNNIYNNIISPNKYIVKKYSFSKNIKTNLKKKCKIQKDNNITKKISNIIQKEKDKIKIYKFFNFWKIKNIKKILINKLHSIYLLYKCLYNIKIKLILKKKEIFFIKLKNYYNSSTNNFIIKKNCFNYYYNYIFKKKILNKLIDYKQNSNLIVKLYKKFNYYDPLRNYRSLLFKNENQSEKYYDNIINISIDLKDYDIRKKQKNKFNIINQKSLNESITKSIKNNNLFKIYKFYSKTKKELLILNKRSNRNNNIQNNFSETKLKQNSNYSKDFNDNSYISTNMIKNIANITYISNINNNSNNFNNSVIEFQKNYIYHRKRIDNSRSSFKKYNKKRYNNSCCFNDNESYDKVVNNENKIEEKQIFFKHRENNEVNNNMDKNSIIMNKNIQIRNYSVVKVSNILSKKNSFYQKFNDIIHSKL